MTCSNVLRIIVTWIREDVSKTLDRCKDMGELECFFRELEKAKQERLARILMYYGLHN